MSLFELFLLGTTLIFAGTTAWALKMNNVHVQMYEELSEVNDRLIAALDRSFGVKDDG